MEAAVSELNQDEKYNRIHNTYAVTKQAFLKQLLDSAETDEQKDQLKKIKKVIRVLFNVYKVDFRVLQKLYMTFIRDSFQATQKIPTHTHYFIFLDLLTTTLQLSEDSKRD